MEEKEERKKRKKMALWLKIVIAVLSIAAVSAPIVFVALPKSAPKRDSVVDVSISAFMVSGLDEEKILENGFAFDEADISSTKRATGGINRQIDADSCIKIVYAFNNKSGKEYLTKIDFYGIGNKNCKITYQIDDGTELPLTDKEIISQGSEDFSVTIRVKVDNINLNSKLTGNILLSIASV